MVYPFSDHSSQQGHPSTLASEDAFKFKTCNCWVNHHGPVPEIHVLLMPFWEELNDWLSEEPFHLPGLARFSLTFSRPGVPKSSPPWTRPRSWLQWLAQHWGWLKDGPRFCSFPCRWRWPYRSTFSLLDLFGSDEMTRWPWLKLEKTTEINSGRDLAAKRRGTALAVRRHG